MDRIRIGSSEEIRRVSGLRNGMDSSRCTYDGSCVSRSFFSRNTSSRTGEYLPNSRKSGSVRAMERFFGSNWIAIEAHTAAPDALDFILAPSLIGED